MEISFTESLEQRNLGLSTKFLWRCLRPKNLLVHSCEGSWFLGEENTKNSAELKMGRKRPNLSESQEDLLQGEAEVSREDPTLLFGQEEVKEVLIMCESH